MPNTHEIDLLELPALSKNNDKIQNALLLKYKKRLEKCSRPTSVFSKTDFKKKHGSTLKEFKFLTDRIYEKVDFFHSRALAIDIIKEEKEKMYFTAYDIHTLYTLKHAISRRKKEYDNLTERKRQLEKLTALEKKHPNLLKALNESTIKFHPFFGVQYTAKDIAFTNQEIQCEIDAIDELLKNHKVEYEKMKHGSTVINQLLGEKLSSERGQVFSVLSSHLPNVFESSQKSSATQEKLKKTYGEHILALSHPNATFTIRNQETMQHEKLTQNHLSNETLSKNPLNIFNDAQQYEGTLTPTGWAFNHLYKDSQEVEDLWIKKALMSGYINNDKGEIYLGGGWRDPKDKDLIHRVYKIAAAAIGQNRVEIAATSITMAEKYKMDQTLKKNNYQLSPTDQNIVKEIQKAFGLKREGDHVIRIAKEMGLIKTEVTAVFESVKNEIAEADLKYEQSLKLRNKG